MIIKIPILASLPQYQPTLLTETPRSAAVMLMVLQDAQNNLEIVITKRSDHLPDYPGHYSLPGGMREAEDENLCITAMRETHEELNVPSSSYEIIGQLDDFMDRYGNVVRPFVCLMPKAVFEQTHIVCATEIAEIYYFPLSEFHRFKDETHIYPEAKRKPTYTFTAGSVFIWGLTAAILAHFFKVIKLV